MKNEDQKATTIFNSRSPRFHANSFCSSHRHIFLFPCRKLLEDIAISRHFELDPWYYSSIGNACNYLPDQNQPQSPASFCLHTDASTKLKQLSFSIKFSHGFVIFENSYPMNFRTIFCKRVENLRFFLSRVRRIEDDFLASIDISRVHRIGVVPLNRVVEHVTTVNI